MKAIIDNNSSRVIACATTATVDGNVVITEDGHIGFDEANPVLIVEAGVDVTGYRYVDGTFVPSLPEIRPKVGPIAFKLLFTSAERIKSKELRKTDAVLEDFWGLLDDPRTTEVDLSLVSVQEAVAYTLDKVKEAGGVLDVDTRLAEILSGQIR